MNRRNVKVIVDYSNGCYNVIGMHNGRRFSIQKPIRGIDKDGKFKDSYKTSIIERRKQKIKYNELIKILNRFPASFKYSDKMLDNVDPMMYRALEDWDSFAGTNYAINYLKTVVQDLDNNKRDDISKKEFESECKKRRTEDLKNSGIYVSYNFGLLHTSKFMTFWDKIKGLLIARKQCKLFDAKIRNSFILRDFRFKYECAVFDKQLRDEMKENSKKYSSIEKMVKERLIAEDLELNPKLSEEDEEKREELLKKAKRMKKIRKKQYKEQRWIRKVVNEQDSIKNKKYNSSLRKAKKAIITGAITLATIGSTVFGINGLTNKGIEKDNNYASSAYSSVILDDENDKDEIDITDESLENEEPQIGDKETEDTQEVFQDVEEEKIQEERSYEEKLEEFKNLATQKYEQAIVIGENPNVGDLLMNQTYSQNPDGTGNKGYFNANSEYSISHINIVTNEGWKVIRTNGKSLSEALAEYPDVITYSIHFVDSKTGGFLGFVTADQYNEMIQNKINQIIEEKNSNLELDEDDFIR